MKKKVLLGMSGGVDSSVSAILLQREGYEVIGATMLLWNDKNKQEDPAIDAKQVCDKLGMMHYTIDCKQIFKAHVMDDFVNCYQKATTPNPCIECNKYLKFGAFFQKAKELKCDYIATGHYAKVEWNDAYNQFVLKKSKAEQKDQTYFLYSINKEVLPYLLLPLADFEEKEQIRSIAKEYDLRIAKKPDSQEVCFIPDNNYGSFLLNHMQDKPKQGDIILQDGTILGKHKGLIYYTVGQRKGLGIAYPKPLYVIKLDQSNNAVIVGEQEQLDTDILHANDLNFLIDVDLDKPIPIKAKVRYRAKEAEAVLEITQNKIAKVTFKEPQRAITPGQSVVFYLGDCVLGGGKII